METKYIVAVEGTTNTRRFLVKNGNNSCREVPYKFTIANNRQEITYFDTKEEAVKACEEALKCEYQEGIILVMEAIFDK